MIVLFTDYGHAGPYVGQVVTALRSSVPQVPVVDLMSDAPRCDPKRAAYLIAALADRLPAVAAVVAVVDPGVGSARHAIVVEADGRWFVGPDNGLLEIVRRRARSARVWEILWRPSDMSASFHGRDLFAPIAARIAAGDAPDEGSDWARRRAVDDGEWSTWPDDLAEIIYIDTFGNAVTGLRAMAFGPAVRMRCVERTLKRARTFSDVSPGTAFCYENANGLLEIAVSMGNAARDLGILVGCPVDVRYGDDDKSEQERKPA